MTSEVPTRGPGEPRGEELPVDAGDEARDRGLNHRRAGAGEPLVLVHGIGSSLRAWAPVTPALERRHDVVALDLPGFGESPPLPAGERSSVPALASAVERELDRLGIPEPHLAGNSLGGWVALELARRRRARSVTALSPAGMASRREQAYATWALILQRAGAERLERHAERLTRTAAGRTALFSVVLSRPWRLDSGEAAYAIRALARAPAFRETLRWIFANAATGMEKVRCPVVIAWGTRDVLLLPRQGPRFVRRIPSARLRPLPGLGHVPMSDDPKLVAETILECTAAAAGAARG